MIGLLTLVLMQVWEPCAPMPTPGYGFACAAVGSRVYAIGGLLSDTAPRLAVEAYDVPADSWITGLASPPGASSYAGCAELDGKIYVIGGWDGHSELARVDRYDPAANTWDTVAPLPWPRWGLAGCDCGGEIYAIGGYSSNVLGYKRTVARFTPDSGAGRWEVVESLYTPRTSPAATIAAGRMCAVGGLYFGALPSFESYTPGAGWYQYKRTMRVARSGAAAVGWGKWLCAIGGQNSHGPLSSVEVVDVDSGSSWLNAAALPTPRVFCGAAVVDGFVVTLGGSDGQGAVAAVEKADSTLFPLSGIEEPEAGVLLQSTPTWATVASGHVRMTCRSAVIYDGSGRRVFAGTGPVDIRLAPGVYFARVSDTDGRLTSGRVTVVR